MVIGIDGRYPLFDWPHNKSTDGSTELLHNKYNAEIVQFREPVEQIDKRNKYLEIAEKEGMDYVLVLDTDDYVHPRYQKWDKLYQQLEKRSDELLFNMWFWESPLHEKNWNTVTDNAWHLYTRVIKPSQVRYVITHWTFIDRDHPELFILPEGEPLEHVRFDSDSTLRNKDYVKRGYVWAEKQMNEENDRMKRAGRMRFNYWLTQLHKALAVPNTVVTMDNTPDKKTEKITQNKSTSSTSQKQRQP